MHSLNRYQKVIIAEYLPFTELVKFALSEKKILELVQQAQTLNFTFSISHNFMNEYNFELIEKLNYKGDISKSVFNKLFTKLNIDYEGEG